MNPLEAGHLSGLPIAEQAPTKPVTGQETPQNSGSRLFSRRTFLRNLFGVGIGTGLALSGLNIENKPRPITNVTALVSGLATRANDAQRTESEFLEDNFVIDLDNPYHHPYNPTEGLNSLIRIPVANAEIGQTFTASKAGAGVMEGAYGNVTQLEFTLNVPSIYGNSWDGSVAFLGFLQNNYGGDISKINAIAIGIYESIQDGYMQYLVQGEMYRAGRPSQQRFFMPIEPGNELRVIMSTYPGIKRTDITIEKWVTGKNQPVRKKGQVNGLFSNEDPPEAVDLVVENIQDGTPSKKVPQMNVEYVSPIWIARDIRIGGNIAYNDPTKLILYNMHQTVDEGRKYIVEVENSVVSVGLEQVMIPPTSTP